MELRLKLGKVAMMPRAVAVNGGLGFLVRLSTDGSWLANGTGGWAPFGGLVLTGFGVNDLSCE